MSVELQSEGRKLIAFISGDIDHHTCARIRSSIDSAVCRLKPELLILDFSSVSFMDSSGIGLVMGRYKLTQSIGAAIRVENLSANAYRVMRLAGLEKLGEIKQKETVG